MDIKITQGLYKKFLKKFPDEAALESVSYYGDERKVDVTIDDFTPEQLNYMEELLKEVEGTTGAQRKISSFRNISLDPAGRKVGRLEDLELALKQFIKDKKNHWLFKEDDNFILPYVVTNIKYHEATGSGDNYCPAYTYMKAECISRGHHGSASVTWSAGDLLVGKTVNELLIDEKLFIPTPELMEAYELSMANYKELHQLTGEQFIADGNGVVCGGEWSRRGRFVSLVKDGVPLKMVMDDTSHSKNEERDGTNFGKDKGVFNDTFWSKQEQDIKVSYPVHPFAKLFDLDGHQFIIVHTDLLTKYPWNPKMGDKLILPEEHKVVIKILMDTAQEELADIIAGKSGGTIVINTGEPGTGKTLTAEVTSEVVKRPLYKVNCSQLGTDEEEIEEELTLVLDRATRWKALLLIDEADVYVRHRGEDIQQNAIVGVFLRILEYYRGVLFLTSNRATVIDDAIMSRSTVHLKYDRPTPEALEAIWRVLSEQFGMKLSPALLKELLRAFPRVVGRDIKNLLKLVKRYSKSEGDKIDLAMFKRLAVHKDIEIVG